MSTLTIKNDSYSLSNKIGDIVQIFARENFNLTNFLFKQLDKKSDELYKSTIDIISILDNSTYDKALEFDCLNMLLPILNGIKDINIDLSQRKKEDNIMLRKHINTIYKFRKSIFLLTDFIEALNQYFEDNGREKISYYLQLIDEYRSEREDNLRLNDEFVVVNLEGWE